MQAYKMKIYSVNTPQAVMLSAEDETSKRSCAQRWQTGYFFKGRKYS